MYLIIKKELRDLWKTLPVAMIAAVAATLSIRPIIGYPEIMFRGACMWIPFYTGSLYAFTLALLQYWKSLNPSVRGWELTQGFDRVTWFSGKAIAALILYAVAFIPIYLLSMLWMVNHYPENGPIAPDAMHAACLPLLWSIVFYPTGVWMMCRPGNWVGSRAVPILYAGTTLLLITAPLYTTGTQLFMWLGCLAYLSAWPAAFYSFNVATNQPTLWNDKRRSSRLAFSRIPQWSAFSGLTVAIGSAWAIGTSIVTLLAIETFPSNDDGRIAHQVIKPKGTLVLLSGKPSKPVSNLHVGGFEMTKYAFSPLKDNGSTVLSSSQSIISPPQEVSNEQASLISSTVNQQCVFTNSIRPSLPFSKFSDEKITTAPDGIAWYFHREGKLYGYKRTFWNGNWEIRLHRIIPLPIDLLGRGELQFLYITLQHFDPQKTSYVYLLSAQGIYEIDLVSGETTQTVNRAMDGAAICSSDVDTEATLVALHQDSASLYKVSAEIGELGNSSTDSDEVGDANNLKKSGRLKFTPGQTVALPHVWNNDNNQMKRSSLQALQRSSDGHLYVVKTGNIPRQLKWFELTDNNERESPAVYEFTPPNASNFALRELLVSEFAPPIFALYIGGWVSRAYVWFVTPIQLTVLILLQVLQIATAMIGVCWFSKRRMLKKKHMLIWMAFAIPLGWAAVWCVAIIHYKIAKAKCLDCHKVISADESTCPYCGSENLGTGSTQAVPNSIKILPPMEALSGHRSEFQLAEPNPL